MGETFLLSRAVCPDVLLSMGLVVGVPLARVSNPHTGGLLVDLFLLVFALYTFCTFLHCRSIMESIELRQDMPGFYLIASSVHR